MANAKLLHQCLFTVLSLIMIQFCLALHIYYFVREYLILSRQLSNKNLYTLKITCSCLSLKGEQENTMLYHGMRPESQCLYQLSLRRSRFVIVMKISFRQS